MKYKYSWKLQPADGQGPVREHMVEVDLDPEEADLRGGDLGNEHALELPLAMCGPVPIVALIRQRGGERVKVPSDAWALREPRARRAKNRKKITPNP